MALSELLRQNGYQPETDDATPQRKFGGSDLATGAELGLRSAVSSAYNLPLVGDPASAAYAEAQAASVPVQYRSSEDIDWTSPSSISGYAAQQIGQMGVSTLPTLAAGLGGAGIARTVMGAAAENLTKAEMARRAATMLNAGRVGAFAADSAQGYGEMAGELRAQGKEPGLMTGVSALAYGGTGVFGLEAGIRSLLHSTEKSVVDSAIKSSRASEILKGAATGLADMQLKEQPGELTQEAIAIGNRAYYDPEYRNNTDDMWGRAKETAIATMFGAGVPGAAAGAVGGLRSAPETNTETRTDERGNTTTISTTGEILPAKQPGVSSALDQIRQSVSPAPSHDMSLDELRAMDSSTSLGETNGESQNATQESTLPPNETGQRQEVLESAGAKAPASSIIDATTGMKKYGYRDFGPLQEKKAFILHHTGPYAEKDGGIDSIQRVFGERQFPAHYIIDRKGQIYQTLPDGTKGHHIKGTSNLTELGKKIGANNSNSIGVEIMANDDNDVTPAQIEAANKLRASLGFSKEQVFGHGELNSHKQKTEGHRAALAIRGEADPDLTGFGKATPTPRTASPYDDIIERAAKQHGVDPDDLRAMMAQESQGDPNATSRKGAGGLMQLMPGTAKEQGVTDLYDPEQNIFGGAKYYRKMLDMFHGDKALAWAAYNAGPGAVQKYGNMIPPFAETQNYVKKVKANHDAIISGRVQTQQRAANPALTAAENAEMARRRIGEENQYQDTALGRAIKGQTETDNEQTGQLYADEGLQFEDTDDGFSLTFKGRKAESTGDDLMRPSRPLPEAEDDTFEGMTPESTPVRAFSEALYPGAKIEISGEGTPNLQRIVSVQFPEEQRQALGEDQKYVARASLEALVSGTKADPKDKILLEHPDVVSSKSDKPIEIPVTKDGLAKLGRALDPGAYDSAPSASHAAAVSGLTHLIYEKGFVPRGVDVSKTKEVQKWIGEKLGKAPVDRTPERAAPEQEDRKVGTPVLERDQSGRTLGRGRAAYQPLVMDQDGGLVAAPDASGATPIRLEQGQYLSVGDEGVPLRSRVTWDNDSLFPATPAASNINNLGTSRKQGVIPDPSIGGFTAEEPPPRVEYEQPPLRTVSEQKLTSVIGTKARQIFDDPKSGITVPKNIENETDKKNYRWAAAVNRAVRELDPTTIEIPLSQSIPTGVETRGENRNRPIMTRVGESELQGQTDLDQELLGKVYSSKEEAVAARDQAINQLTERLVGETEQRLQQAQDAREVESVLDEVARRTVGLVGGKLVGTKAPTFDRKQEILNVVFGRSESGVLEKNQRFDAQVRESLTNEIRTKLAGAGLKTAYALRKTEGGYRVVPAGKTARTATSEDVAHAAELVKRDFQSEQFRQSQAQTRDELSSEAGKNLESMPLRDELTEDQLLATEAQAGIADDRAAMSERQRGLTSSFSPAQAKQQTRRSVENTTNKVEDTAKRTRELDSESIETVHKVSGGATVRATGVSDKVVRFFTEALKDIGLEVPLRVMSKAGITQHLDALQQRLDGLVEAIQREEETLSRMPNMLKEEKKARKEQEKKVLTLRRALQDASREQELLLQAQEDQFAARVIYNDHYQDATRRVPVIIVSDEAAASKHLTKVLGHELGHVVQRAWFDQLPSELKKDILQELSENGAYTGDIAEAFADKFLSWYERNKRGEKIKDKQEGIRAKKMEGVLQRLVNALQRLWNNLVGHDKAFAKEYPKFDEFLRSTVGVYGRMKPINPAINKLWTESLAQPYGGLPLAVADRERFNNMTVDEFNQTVTDAAKQRLDQAQKWASGKPIAQKQVTKDYIDRFNATINAMKTGARYWLLAEGERLRGSFEGLFAGWGDVYAPQVGVARTGGQVIKGRLHTNRIMGTFDNHVKRIAAKYLKPKTALLEQYNKLSDAEKAALLANVRDERMPAKSTLARDIRTYFRLLRSGLIDAGVLDPRQRKQNYTAKMWGAGKFADLKMRNEIIDRFTKVFEARQELPVETRERMRVENPDGTHYYGWHEVRYTSAKRAAEDLYERISTGQTDSIIDQDPEAIEKGLRSSAFPFSRSRPFSEDEYAAYNLHEFLEDDLGYIIQNYTQQAAKRIAQIEATGIPRDQLKDPKTRAAWKARFEAAKLDPQLMYTPTAALDLLLAEGVVDGRIGTKDEYNEARSLLMSSLGMKNVGTSPRRRRWINRIVAYQTILTMPWSAFSALSDFGIAAWRGESLERAGEALRKTFGKESRAKQENLLRLIGLALEESTRHAMQSDTVMAADPMARGSHRMTEAFFKWNGMEYLSHTNMIFASVLGQSYIKDYADQAVNGKTEKERADAMKRLRMLHPDMTPHHVLTAEFDTDDQLQVALMEFISQAHLHDQKGYTPEVFNDYRFKIFTMLKGFSFKYHNIVLKQVWERMKDQPDLLHAAIPVVTLAAATMPLALAGMEAKDLLRRRLLPQTKRMKEKTAAQKLHDVVMASGLPGVYVSMFDDMLEAPQHGQPGFIALMGPVIGSAYNFSARSLDESIPAYTPGVAYFPWFRAMARQGLRDTFGFGVRDEEE